ncbi:MAG: sulfur carrier protein ThiS [Actinomycetota bacterium]
MRLQVNGKAEEVRDGGTIRDVVELLGITEGRGVAVAVDGDVVERARWDDTGLRDGQRIEILHAVQGG